MLFSSFPFLVLLLITVFLYYLPSLAKFQIYTLIVSSLIFYAYENPILLILLVVSVSINIITSYYVVYGNQSRRKLNAVIGVTSNLLILAFFKYSPLFAKTFLEKETGISDFLINIPLPIGISFFTFQGISLMIDVFDEKHFNSKQIVPVSLLDHTKNTFFFITFFPQLVSGPVVKAHDFLPQIRIKKLNDINWESVIKSLILGYFLKMVIANQLNDFTFWMKYPYFQGRTSIDLISILIGYSCQIFADFAGYSLIAIGLAQLFGYQLEINFNFPYIAASFKEFWKRWHISLSSFLMEYLYFPLGGNRKGKYRTYVNLMITMVLGGLWHGASWNYAFWGGIHGVALAVERFFLDRLKIKETIVVVWLKRILVFFFVTCTWLLFKVSNFSHFLEYFKTIYTNYSYSYNSNICHSILLYSLPVFLYHAFYLMKNREYFVIFRKYEFLIYGILFFLIITNSGKSNAFVYFQF
jgi:alginate O-acetyltransferase complex protein AlgI